jgi:hypothetical protein
VPGFDFDELMGGSLVSVRRLIVAQCQCATAAALPPDGAALARQGGEFFFFEGPGGAFFFETEGQVVHE